MTKRKKRQKSPESIARRNARRVERKIAAEIEATEREYSARKRSERLFDAARIGKAPKRKKTTDAIVHRGEAILRDRHGNVVLNEFGEPLMVVNTRKGPTGRTKAYVEPVIGVNRLAEAHGQIRMVEYIDTVNLQTAKAGFIQTRTLQANDGTTFPVLSANPNAAINKGITATDGTVVVPKVTAWKGNPVKGSARKLRKDVPLVNDKRNTTPKRELVPMVRDFNAQKPIPEVQRNAPPSPVRAIQGCFDANEDFRPYGHKSRVHPVTKKLKERGLI